VPSPEPSVLGHILEGRIERDPLTGSYQLMTIDSNGRAQVVSLQDLVAPYEGKDVRLTLASFENLDRLARMAEQVGGGLVSGVMPEDLPGVSFNIQRGSR
jgi:hypothetical protein